MLPHPHAHKRHTYVYSWVKKKSSQSCANTLHTAHIHQHEYNGIGAAITSEENSLCSVEADLSFSRTHTAISGLSRLSNFVGVTGSYSVFFSGKESSSQQRQTQNLITLDVDSIRTYWEVWGCCCWPHRCFLCPTCQRHFPSTSPFCPCGRFVGGDACDVDSFWALAHQCKWCGDLWKTHRET